MGMTTQEREDTIRCIIQIANKEGWEWSMEKDAPYYRQMPDQNLRTALENLRTGDLI